jgi:hypothetical protein
MKGRDSETLETSIFLAYGRVAPEIWRVTKSFRKFSGKALNPMIHHCSFEGCGRTTERPALEAWRSYDQIPKELHVPEGLYCPEHAAHVEALISSEFE